MGTRKNYVVNAGGAYSIQVGSVVPEPGIAGRMYIDTEYGVIYLDTGSNWEPLQMGPAGPQGLLGVNEYIYVYRTGGNNVSNNAEVVFNNEDGATSSFISYQIIPELRLTNQEYIKQYYQLL